MSIVFGSRVVSVVLELDVTGVESLLVALA